MKLTRKILKQMILENFPTKYEQSSFSTPNIPVPSMIRRKNPNYDPEDPKSKEPEYLPAAVPSEYSQSFENFIGAKASMFEKIKAINLISDSIARKDFKTFAKALDIDIGRSSKKNARVILNACLIMDFFSYLAREQDAYSGAYLFEGLTALLVGGTVAGGEGLAHDAVGQDNQLYSSKWIKLSEPAGQQVSGFPKDKSIIYLIAQKYSEEEAKYAGDKPKTKDFTSVPGYEYTKSEPERGKIYGSADAIEIMTLSLFLIEVKKVSDGQTRLNQQQMDDFESWIEYQKALVEIFNQEKSEPTEEPEEEGAETTEEVKLSELSLEELVEKIIEKFYPNGFSKKAKWYTEYQKAGEEGGIDINKPIYYPPNQDWVKNFVSQIKKVAKARAKIGVDFPVFQVSAINRSGEKISLSGVNPTYKTKKAGDKIERTDYETGDSPKLENRDFFDFDFDITSAGTINWTIKLEKAYSTVEAFLRHEAAKIKLITSSGQLLKDEIATTFGSKRDTGTFKDLVKETYNHLREYFSQMDESEKQTRLYFANGRKTHATSGLDSINKSAVALDELINKLVNLKK